MDHTPSSAGHIVAGMRDASLWDVSSLAPGDEHQLFMVEGELATEVMTARPKFGAEKVVLFQALTRNFLQLSQEVLKKLFDEMPGTIVSLHGGQPFSLEEYPETDQIWPGHQHLDVQIHRDQVNGEWRAEVVGGASDEEVRRHFESSPCQFQSEDCSASGSSLICAVELAARHGVQHLGIWVPVLGDLGLHRVCQRATELGVRLSLFSIGVFHVLEKGWHPDLPETDLVVVQGETDLGLHVLPEQAALAYMVFYQRKRVCLVGDMGDSIMSWCDSDPEVARRGRKYVEDMVAEFDARGLSHRVPDFARSLLQAWAEQA